MVDKPKTLDVYLGYAVSSFTVGDKNPIEATNFVPGDGVFTEQIINWNGDHPDYVVAVSNTRTIDSRWYVIESTRTRGGQYQIRLFRDLFADYYDEIMSAPAFIEKGYVPVSDSAIYNPEGITFNQIKRNEFLLKDNTKSAWIVGYCAVPETNETATTIKFGGIPEVAFDVPAIEDWEYSEFYRQGTVKTTKMIVAESLKYNVFSTLRQGNPDTVKTTFNSSGNISVETLGKTSFNLNYYCDREDVPYLNRYTAYADTDTTALNEIGYVYYDATPEELEDLSTQKIKVGNTYYEISVNVETEEKTFEVPYASNVYNALSALIANGVVGDNDEIIHPIKGTSTLGSFTLTYTEKSVSLFLEEITTNTGLEFTWPVDRPVLTDAPYCMFCIPYSNEYQVKTANKTFRTKEENALSLATGIATSLDSKLYDIQLLPYSPLPLLRNAGRGIDLTTNTSLNYIVDDDLVATNNIVFWCLESSGTFDIVYNQYVPTDPIQFKINALTRFQRLCSPNYNGVFEFSVEKNNGVSSINVDYTYKPYQPYIHLNPNFGGLYGRDFNDARGLICGGDFSLPITQDAWTNYQIQNKNYQEMFDRQIQNIETIQEISKRREVAQVISGTISGTVAGAGAGSFIGGGTGALIGGAVGGLASIGAGIADVRYNDMLRNEAIDYTKDQFGYNLQNIIALPNSLTKISAYNANNKIFPFIERYVATYPEEEALKNKLIYNGMSIGRIGTLYDTYINKPATLRGKYGYFKGQLIRIEGIKDDSHVANAIAQEYNKGWYMI